MASDHEPLDRPPLLQSKQSTRSLLSVATTSIPVAFLGSDATTAVTLASADQAELTPFEDPPPGTSKPLLTFSTRSNSPQPSCVVLPSNLASDPSPFVELLHDFVNTSMVNSSNNFGRNKEFNVLTDKLEILDQSFLDDFVHISKLGLSLSSRLKHFFVLSSAGKPIYSMNGDDDLVLGYSGLITTIVASFEEGTGLSFRSISQKGFRMVVMNKSPLVLVAITKIAYELPLGVKILERQLSLMFDYLLAVLSSPTITKSFHNRMNYDLRRILSAQDFRTLDTLATKLSYGFYDPDGDNKYVADPSLYLGTLLDGSVQCARLSSTLRTKIDDILLASKRIRVNQPIAELVPFLQGKLYNSDTTRYLAADLLFAFLIFDGKIVSYMRPKTHSLDNQDMTTLFSTVEHLYSDTSLSAEEPDLWVPICLPNFNDAGFLYCYVRHTYLAQLGKPLSLLLLSGNKNSFFDMKQISEYIIGKINKSKTLCASLPQELAHVFQPLVKILKVPAIRHFIYKRRKDNQFYMDPIRFPGSVSENIIDSMHYLYLYTALYSSKAQEVKIGTNLKKLTYTRWHMRDGYTGFLLSDEKYEFMCLCLGFVPSLQLIEQSLSIINWCERYRKRLFIGDGVQF